MKVKGRCCCKLIIRVFPSIAPGEGIVVGVVIVWHGSSPLITGAVILDSVVGDLASWASSRRPFP